MQLLCFSARRGGSKLPTALTTDPVCLVVTIYFLFTYISSRISLLAGDLTNDYTRVVSATLIKCGVTPFIPVELVSGFTWV